MKKTEEKTFLISLKFHSFPFNLKWGKTKKKKLKFCFKNEIEEKLFYGKIMDKNFPSLFFGKNGRNKKNWKRWKKSEKILPILLNWLTTSTLWTMSTSRMTFFYRLMHENMLLSFLHSNLPFAWHWSEWPQIALRSDFNASRLIINLSTFFCESTLLQTYFACSLIIIMVRIVRRLICSSRMQISKRITLVAHPQQMNRFFLSVLQLKQFFLFSLYNWIISVTLRTHCFGDILKFSASCLLHIC